MTRSRTQIRNFNAWTFNSRMVARKFDVQVRQHHPWYDVAMESVGHLARSYIPTNGLVYDIGASTGLFGRTVASLLTERNARLIAIENSPAMVNSYRGPGELKIADAIKFDYEPFDFGVLFLVLRFFPVATRQRFLLSLRDKLRPGGAIIVVDRVYPLPGSTGAALRLMSLKTQLEAGATADLIIEKELGLAGAQKPLDPVRELAPCGAEQWFQFGDFAGWIIEKGGL